MKSPLLLAGLALVLALASPPSARGYLALFKSLGDMSREATQITILQVERVHPEKRVILFQKVADLKGNSPDAKPKQHISGGLHARESEVILDWAEPGQLAVLFRTDSAAIVCTGRLWYECAAHPREAGVWSLTRLATEQSFAYHGSAERLRRHLRDILAGQEVQVSAVQSTLDRWKAIAMRDDWRHTPTWRIKASLRIHGWPASGEAGVGSAKDVPALLESLRHTDPLVRAEAADILAAIGPAARDAIPALRKQAADPDGRARVSVARALAQLDPEDATALPTILQALKDDSAGVRRAAAVALGDLRPLAETATLALGQCLAEPDPRMRRAAAEALKQLGPWASPAVPALRHALPDDSLRCAVAEALGAIGPGARDVLPALREAFAKATGPDRWTLAVALVRISPEEAKLAVPLFTARLRGFRDTDKDCYDTLGVLAVIGSNAKEATPAVIDGILSRRFQRGWSLTVWAINREASIPFFIEDLRGADPALQQYAAAYLGYSGPLGKAALPTLRQYAQQTSDLGRISAWAVALIEGDYPTAVPLLRRGMRASLMGYLGGFSQKAFDQLGPGAQTAVPQLIDALKDDIREVRVAVAAALGRIGNGARAASVPLQQALKDEHWLVRAAAAEALLRIQRSPSVATPAKPER